MKQAYLASELQKFYRKITNKLIFTNGMTLNQLALEMWTALGYEGIDASLLSRIVNGERLFTKKQLRAFCKILGLGAYDRYVLENALGKDLLRKHLGVVISLSEYDELLADPYTADMLFSQIRKLKNNGSIHEAIQMASFFIDVFNFTPKIQKANSALYAKILNEKVRCLGYTEKPNTLYPKIQKLTKTALRIGKELNDPDITDMAHMNIGGCLYVAKRIEESTKYLEQTFNKVNNKTKVEYVRTLLINYAMLRNDSSYKETYKKADTILSEKEEYNKSHITSMYEAISRSLALMGRFQEAKKFLDTIDSSRLETFYQSELLRGKVFVRFKEFSQNGKADKDEITELLLKSQQNKFRAFQRHQAQITTMYREMNNG